MKQSNWICKLLRFNIKSKMYIRPKTIMITLAPTIKIPRVRDAILNIYYYFLKEVKVQDVQYLLLRQSKD